MPTESNIQDVYSLSPMQEGILYHYLRDPSSDAYLIQTVYTIRGLLNIEYVRKSLHDLSRRYDMLRTVFVYGEVDDILQVVLQDRSIGFTYKDLRTISSEEDRRTFAQQYKEDDRSRPFDLAADVMMRVGILQLSDTDYEFIWNFHHILMDGWCMAILTDEYQKIYEGYETGNYPDLPPVTQYKNFIEWLLVQDQRPAKEYWAGYLSGYARLNSVPGKKRSRAGARFDLSEVCLELDEARAGDIASLALKNRVTTYTLLQAVWGILLSRYNNTNDVVFGSVVSGRPPSLPGAETMVGLFINTVPARVRYNDATTFGELLKIMQEQALEGSRFHYCRLAEIQSETVTKQNLLDHIMVFENYPTLSPSFPQDDAIVADRVGGEEIAEKESWDHANYDFFIVIVPGNGLRVRFCFDKEVYEERFIAAIPGHFRQLIDQVCSDTGSGAVISELPIATVAERELLKGFSGADVVYGEELTIGELFAAQVRKSPEGIAVSCEGRELSYGELNDRGNRLGNWLRERYGIGAGELVGVMMERSDWLVTAMVGIVKSGAGYVPVDPSYPEERKRYMLEDAGIKCLLTERGMTGSVPSGCEVVELAGRWEEEIGLSSGEEVEGRVSSGDILYVIYTSGSTGRPKGCVIEHRSLHNLVNWHCRVFGLSGSSRATVYSGIGFDASLWEMWPYLLSGGCLFPVKEKEKYALGLLVEKLCREGITHCFVPTRICEELLGMGGMAGRELYILTGGEKLLGYGGSGGLRVVNNYGLSEAAVVSTSIELRDWRGEGAVPLGRPIDNTRIYILDRGMQLQPVGVEGELWVSGRSVGRGYLNREELTSERFVENPYGGEGLGHERLYRTGDRGRWLSDGTIEYLGRKDRQVKLRGYRIELGEIEEAMNSCAGIEGAVVVARGEGSDRHVVGYYRVSGGKVSREEVEGHLRVRLPGHMVPSWLVEVEQYPLTEHGKLDEGRLPDPVSGGYGRGGVGEERVLTETEEVLVRIWEEVLGGEGIGVRDNFFELGGHSIKAIQLVFQITRALSADIQLTDVFEWPTIEELGRVIEERGRREQEEIGVVEEQEDYEVSHAQKRLWIIDQLEGEKTAYNIFGSYVFEGELDRGALERSFGEVVDRHESLRTVFVSREGEPRQKILSREELGYRLKYVDLREEEEGEQRARELSEEESVRGFDLTRGPLLRTKLLRMGERRYVFLMTLHHIISDGWSMEVMVRELLGLYEGYSRGEERELKGLRIQYKDYAAWQNGLLGGEEVSSHRKYWREQLGGELPVLELPTDYHRPQVKRNNGSVIGTVLEKGVREGLQKKSQEKGLTIFMVLVAAVKILLHRYSGQEDIIVGTPTAGREHPDLEDQIGFYVNTLALRSQVRGERSIDSLLEEIRTMMVEAYAHQVYPFDRLVEELEVVRDLSRMPVFDVLVVFQNMELGGSGPDELSGIAVGQYVTESTVSKYDLTFIFHDFAEGVSLQVEYSTDLFSRERVERLVNHYRRVLDGVIADGSQGIGKMEYMESWEREQLLGAFNDTRAGYPESATVIGLFEEQVRETPDAIALVCEGRELSYGELNERSNQLGWWLRERYGIRGDDLVGILADRSEWMIIGILGILKAGAGYVPIDPEYPQERKRYIIEDAGIKCLLLDHEGGEGDHNSGVVRFRNLWTEEIGKEARTDPERINTAKDITYVIYTSGSTGRPKGCIIDNEGTVSRIHWAWLYYGFNGSDVFLQRTPLIFDVSVWEIFMTLCYGAKLVMCPKEIVYIPDSIAEYIDRYKITAIYFVPTLLNAFLENMEAANIPKLRTLRRVMVSGEVLTSETVRKYYKMIQVPLINLYGPTEASVNVSHYTTKKNDSLVPIGKPIGNVKLYILDKNMALVPVGIPGEICIGGIGLARGYRNRPDITKSKFTDDPFTPGEKLYKTGDLGVWLEDGNIEYLRRDDGQIKLRGYRIELQEIEAVISEYDGIESAVVTAKGSGQDKYLVGYFKGRNETDAAELKKYVQRMLPVYMVPAYLVKVSDFVLTSSGKIDRNKLPDPVELGAGASGHYEAPGNPIEAQLAAVWMELLGRKDISINDGFFELGGNSIKLIGVRAKLLALGFIVDMPQLYRFATIKALSAVIKRNSEEYIPEQTTVEGQVEFTPLQYSYLRESDRHTGYFGWSIVVHAPQGFDRKGLYAAIGKLLEHHDALRINFSFFSGKAIQMNNGTSFSCDIQEHDLMLEERPLEKLHQVAMLTRAAMTIEQASLMKLLVFRMRDGDRMILLIHELIFDEYSWKILIRDLAELYRQYLTGEKLELGLKTCSFKAWANYLHAYADSEALLREKPFWMQMEDQEYSSILRGRKKEPVNIGSIGTLTVELDHKSTGLLLTRLNRMLGMSPEGILLAALSLAIERIFKKGNLLINLRRDGRRAILPGVETIRTIGCFSYCVPVQLTGAGEEDLLLRLARTRQTLKTLPKGGIGYSILQHITHPDNKKQLAFALRPEIGFSYVGRLDEDVSDDLPEIAIESFARHSWGMGKKEGLLMEVSAAVTGEFLVTTFVYESSDLDEEDILNLKDEYRKILMQMAYCAVSGMEDEVQVRGDQEDGSSLDLPDLIPETDGKNSDTGSYSDVVGLLKSIWGKVLSLDKPGIHEDFFKLGGVSALSIFAVHEIYKKAGLPLKLADIFNYPTIDRLAVYIGKGQPDRVRGLVQFNTKEQNRPSIFLIPPADGIPNLFLAMADLLKDQLNCYGYLFHGYHRDQALPASREELTRQIAQEIYETSEFDPVMIVGYSWSGSIAFELTKELESMGKTVKLVIIDLSVDNKVFTRQRNYTMEEMEQAFEIDKYHLPVYFKDLLKRVALNNYKLFLDYRTTGFVNADILSIAAGEGEKGLDIHAWSKFTGGKLTVHTVDGNHWNVLEKSFRQISASILDFAQQEYSGLTI